MFKQEGPYARAALRMLREFAPTMAIWLVAMLGWGWFAQNDRAWLVLGLGLITLPFWVEYADLLQRTLDELDNE